MKVLIDIPEQYLKLIHSDSPINWVCMSGVLKFIRNGIVLDELTNGEVIKKMFPNGKITEESYVVFAHIEECDHPFDKAWWNRKWGE